LGKKTAIVMIMTAFVLGFVTGSVVAIVKRPQNTQTAARLHGSGSALQ